MTADAFWVGPPADPDRYRLVSLLGGGGEGEVWDAVLPLSEQGRSTVAVKILPARPGDEREFERFGRLLRMLGHPGLVRVTEVFTGPPRHRGRAADPRSRANYVVMDLVDGVTLREWCDENPDAAASARLKMLRTVASALDEMHAGTTTNVPVAHGDVKPANVVVRPDGGTVLVDLGLARLADGTGVSGLTRPYAAPELRHGPPVATPESDRYAFAVTTAQVLAGQPVPTDRDGWLDVDALADLLRRSPVTARRPVLVKHVLDAIVAPPEARPPGLRGWLDAASETLSQVTTGDGAAPTPHRVRPVTQPGHSHVPPPAAASPRRRRSRFPLFAGGLIAVLVVGIVVAAVILSPQSPGPGAGAGAPAAAGVDPGGERAAPLTTTPPTGIDDRPREAAHVTDLTVVERDGREGDNGYNSTETAQVSGRQYGRAITLYATCGNDDGGDYWVDYDLARSWQRFTATVGLDDRSPAASSATYTILLDGQPVSTGPLTLGQAAPVDVPASGALRLRLRINDPGAVAPDCDGRHPRVVFADPAVAP